MNDVREMCFNFLTSLSGIGKSYIILTGSIKLNLLQELLAPVYS